MWQAHGAFRSGPIDEAGRLYDRALEVLAEPREVCAEGEARAVVPS